jgi:hypothetical protein
LKNFFQSIEAFFNAIAAFFKAVIAGLHLWELLVTMGLTSYVFALLGFWRFLFQKILGITLFAFLYIYLPLLAIYLAAKLVGLLAGKASGEPAPVISESEQRRIDENQEALDILMHHVNPMTTIDTAVGLAASFLTGKAFLDENFMPIDPKTGKRRP